MRSESWWSSSSTTTAPTPGSAVDGVLGVGGHQVGEVRRAERRRQPQVHLDVAAVRRATERTKPRSVIGSSSSGSTTVPSAARTSLLGSGRRSSQASRVIRPIARSAAAGLAGTGLRLVGVGQPQLGRAPSMSYSFAALSPSIFFFCAVVSGRVLGHVLGDLEVHELLDQPLRRPQRVVAGEQDPVLADPVDELADDLREVARPGVDERHRDGQPAVHVGLLGGDPAEVLQPGQPDVLDDEVQVGEVGGHVVDVGHVEGVAVQRPDRRALVHVDVA